MSDISNIRDVYNWSIAKIAEAFALDRKAVKRKLLDANIPVANTIRGNPVYNLRDVGPALFGSPASADPDDIHDPSKMEPKDRKDWFQSENERVKLEVSTRQLVHGDEVREQLSCIVKAVTQVLDTWPDKLERDKGWNVAQIDEAQSMVDELRDTLADEVINYENE
ncbi:DUF1441 family protein [Salmonella enterica subsp. enterica]|uniref:DUF1441 family protein n=10 Tax=Salmonella enterica TaxID=28901 RepID=A0A600JHF1_SALET|nr:DUF1441 family protein [Salmonella enterica]EAA8828643.1 DUF1441 family protein [Salmonella enterica subsp. enterica serovar Javiana]EAO5527523.1 DUF1441 family protein [Salmonella enterica subsp. enterica serovar Hvittingfoss]EBC8952654.1 DUF1441 family protein [Salmonella enterica subsp. enterica serovar Bareilly]EBF8289761.1 DUF1441 family protein [Salmonella enterica subsp. houtenae]EBH8171563.1 DUF1441 family protein [Salmonella enterica subsp. enterica serovar Typhimurium str. UK-1]E